MIIIYSVTLNVYPLKLMKIGTSGRYTAGSLILTLNLQMLWCNILNFAKLNLLS